PLHVVIPLTSCPPYLLHCASAVKCSRLAKPPILPSSPVSLHLSLQSRIVNRQKGVKCPLLGHTVGCGANPCKKFQKPDKFRICRLTSRRLGSARTNCFKWSGPMRFTNVPLPSVIALCFTLGIWRRSTGTSSVRADLV